MHLNACRYILKLIGCRFSSIEFSCLMVVKNTRMWNPLKSAFLTVFCSVQQRVVFELWKLTLKKKTKQKMSGFVYVNYKHVKTCILPCHCLVTVVCWSFFWWLMKTGKIQRSLFFFFFNMSVSHSVSFDWRMPWFADCWCMNCNVKHIQISIL